jgi:hypothetical protein
MEAMDYSHPFRDARSFLLHVHELYERLLAETPPGDLDEEPSLGGKLVYIGELDQNGRSLVVAANIAGTASLSATADPVLQREVIRDGLVDFVVNSLDEALRILKNEIRKKNAVAVCVGALPHAIEAEMQERGVMPDVLRSLLPPSDVLLTTRPSAIPAADILRDADSPPAPAIVFWSVSSAPAQWLPRLDAIASECLAADALAARRWLRLAPRYVGRSAREVRLLRADEHFADVFLEKVQASFEAGEIYVPARIEVRKGGGISTHDFPPTSPLPNRMGCAR